MTNPNPDTTTTPAADDDPPLGALIDSRLEALLGAATGPTNWAAVGPADAAQTWTALRTWVDWFRGEFGYDHRTVPPCWYQHPTLVSLLSALRDHWSTAYDPLNAPPAASEWHRVLAMLEPRLRDWAARTGCTPGTHRPDPVLDWPDDTDQFEAHVRADIARRRQQQSQR